MSQGLRYKTRRLVTHYENLLLFAARKDFVDNAIVIFFQFGAHLGAASLA